MAKVYLTVKVESMEDAINLVNKIHSSKKYRILRSEMSDYDLNYYHPSRYSRYVPADRKEEDE